MKIMVETNLDFGWKIKEGGMKAGDAPSTITTVLYEGEVELGTRPTIRDLLAELSRQYSKAAVVFIDSQTNEVDPDEYLVMVNGRAWEFLPQRLETELNEGDRVSITKYLDLLGGG